MLRLLSFQLKKPQGPQAILSGSGFVGGRVGLMLPTAAANQILDLPHYLQTKTAIKPPSSITEHALHDMNALIESGEESIAWLHEILRHSHTVDNTAIHQTNHIHYLPPLFPRRNIMCVGKNYKDHVAEVAKADKQHGIGTTSASTAAVEAPKFAQFFTKLPSTVVAHQGEVQSHSTVTQWLDYEAELAIIIGKQGCNISTENAMNHIFGFTIANDITARDVQRHHNQWFRGKSLDTTCPLGPMITHKSSPINPFQLNIQFYLNSKQMQNSNTSNMIFNIPEIIRQLSVGLTLMPGDVILTGTPEGVGYARKPPIVLKAGDHMAVEIEHLGRLENTVV